jgi:diacylglycerol kinase (ATP)
MIESEIRGLIKSFSFALRGLKYCIKNERNIRVHIVVAIFVLTFSFIFELNRSEYAILVISIFFVITTELINTSIETIVNLETSCYDNLARFSKDIAAGAVFVSSICSIIVGLLLFLKPEKLSRVMQMIFTTPTLFSLFGAIIILGSIFIIMGTKNKFKKLKLNNFEE